MAHLVGDHAEAALVRGQALCQHVVDEAEELLHDRILAQVVVAALHQLPVALPRAAQEQRSPAVSACC